METRTTIRYSLTFKFFYFRAGARRQGGDLPKIPGGTAIAYKVENALKSPKTSKPEVEIRWHGAASSGRRAGHGRVRSPPCDE